MGKRLAISALVLGVACCNKGSTSPSTTALPAGPVTNVGLRLLAPSTIAPGQSVQLVANVLRSDGSVANVSGQAEWTVRSGAQSSVLSVTATGLATGRDRGEDVVTARFGGWTDHATVLVLPDGTFRLAGTVTDNGVGLDKATVTVIFGVGQGLSASTNASGDYAIYGVAGPLEVRATREGYLESTRHVTVTGDGSQPFEMVASAPKFDVSGTYTLTVSAEGSSGSCLPEPLKRRTYTATIEQTKAGALSVSLSGADFVIARDGSGSGFRGAIAATGDVRFSISPATVWDYDGPEVVERLNDGTVLCVAGTIEARSSPAGIFGTGDPSRGATIYLCPASGYLVHSGCSIEHFDMVRR